MYTAPKRDIWSGRVDSNEENLGLRWHQKISLIDLNQEQLPKLKQDEKGIIIIGFCSDEGVRRNKGRTGAKEGPEAIRKACCNHAYHFDEKTIFYDGGNVVCENEELESAQTELRGMISNISESGYFPFVFGGGHEVAYPHFMGLSDTLPENQSMGIINIDAHFDLRIPEPDPSSGTPFFQIANDCELAKKNFKYFCIGIQQSSNTQALFQRARSLGVEYFTAHDLFKLSKDHQINKLITFIQSVDSIYLTICLDVFDISVAPGVSAPSTIGLKPESALPLIHEIAKTGKLIGADLAELNPSLDQNEMTAKLAGKLVYEILMDL